MGSQAQGLTDEVVEQAARGDCTASARLAQALALRVPTLVAMRLGRSRARRQAAEDLAQEVLVGILRGIPHLRDRTLRGLTSFVSAVVENKVRSAWASLRRDAGELGGALSLEEFPESVVSQPRAQGDDEEDAEGPLLGAMRDEELARVLEALAFLAPIHRRVIGLALFERLDAAEIGERLGLSRNAAAMRLKRAREALRRVIRQREGGRVGLPAASPQR